MRRYIGQLVSGSIPAHRYDLLPGRKRLATECAESVAKSGDDGRSPSGGYVPGGMRGAGNRPVAGSGGRRRFRSDREPIGWTGADHERCALWLRRPGYLPEFSAEPSAPGLFGAAVRRGAEPDSASLSIAALAELATHGG